MVALLATYADDAKIFEHPSKLLGKGSAELRERYAARFQEPNLHARLLGRTAMGNLVIDHELVTRDFPEGPGTVELIAMYEVQGEKIVRAWFKFGEKRLQLPES